MNTIGTNLKLSIFGESHGALVGCTIDGLPCGLSINHQKIVTALSRRLGEDSLSTKRRELEKYEIASGVFNDLTDGSPLTIIIPNTKYDDRFYENKGTIRPGHSDYPYSIKYKGFNDFRGGGHASGRLTAPLVVMGAIIDDILAQKGIIVYAYIKRIADLLNPDQDYTINQINTLKNSKFPIIDESTSQKMKEKIKDISDKGDSVGGEVSVKIENLPCGLGEPFFNSFESLMAQMVFSIPGIKGICFGDGIDIATSLGSEMNDEMQYCNGQISFLSNHCGGCLGGVTTGQTIKYDVIVRAPSSIKKEQRSIDLLKKENMMISTEGQHDPCIVPRVIPVLEALSAFVVYDFLKGLNNE